MQLYFALGSPRWIICWITIYELIKYIPHGKSVQMGIGE